LIKRIEFFSEKRVMVVFQPDIIEYRVKED